MRIRSQADFWCGLLFAAIGVAVVLLAREYRLGTAARMGPGYFPTLLGYLLAALGLTLTLPAFFVDGDEFPRIHFRSLLTILVSIAVFGVTFEYFGFALAVAALVIVGGFAEPELRPIDSAALALFMVIFSIGIFVGLLGLPLNLWPEF